MFLTRGASTFTAYAFLYARPPPSGGPPNTQFFTVAIGRTDDTAEPWLTVDSGRELSKYLSDLKKLGAVGSRLEKRSVVLEDTATHPSMWADVSLEKGVLDGQEVYCIDILYF